MSLHHIYFLGDILVRIKSKIIEFKASEDMAKELIYHTFRKKIALNEAIRELIDKET